MDVFWHGLERNAGRDRAGQGGTEGRDRRAGQMVMRTDGDEVRSMWAQCGSRSSSSS